MSYRTYVNDVQVFGNNEYYPEWIEFIKTQGIDVNENGNYEGDITDFMDGLKCVETIVLRMEKERQDQIKELSNKSSNFYKSSLFDLTNIYQESINALEENDEYEISLFDRLYQFLEDGYIFMPYAFFKACEYMLEKDHVFSTKKHFNCFKLKEGKRIHVKAC